MPQQDRPLAVIKPRRKKSKESRSREAATPTSKADGGAAAREEVDDLFGKLLAKKTPQGDQQTPNSRGKGKKPTPGLITPVKVGGEQKVFGSKDDLFGTGQKAQRRRDPDGLSIYTEDEFKAEQGGDTPQCPFDCDCCLI